MIAGHPLIEWSWRAACRVRVFDAVWIATDSREVAECVEAFGGVAVMTSAGLASGTDRVAEVASSAAARQFDIVGNFQADEPFLMPEAVEAVVARVRSGAAELATLAVPIRSADEWRSESVVKVVRAADGRALYFSRAGIPYARGSTHVFGRGAGGPLRHVGFYVATRAALERWAAACCSELEKIEHLEQLRVLEAGDRIDVVLAEAMEPGVDGPEDLIRAARLLREQTTAVEWSEHV